MKILNGLSKILFVLICLYSFIYHLDYTYVFKAIRVSYFTGHSTAFLEDYAFFENATIKATNGQPWPLHEAYNAIELSQEHLDFHKESKSIAFLVFKNDQILLEQYYDGFSTNSKTNSFSVAKSYVVALLGKAIKEGYVNGLDQKVIDFLPELSGDYAHQVTMGDLASMSAGMQWQEEYYLPINVTTESYFTPDLYQLMMAIPIQDEPGQAYHYQSGATQLLGLALAKATKRSLSDYLQQSIWHPLGYQQDAFWQLDSKKHRNEKSFCCLASNARDFARLAKLYKNHGRWNGQQILDSTFVSRSLTPRFEEAPHYGYGFWFEEFENKSAFLMKGHSGQYVITFPSEDLIIVRLGHKELSEDIETFMAMGLEVNSQYE